MALVLYHHNLSVCSEKVRMALNEKGIGNWQSREVDILGGEQFSPEYMKLNPKAVVPTLVHDGHAVTESTLISEYVDEAFDGPALQPESAFERAEMRLYSKACDEGLHQGVGVMSFAASFMDRMRDAVEQDVDKHLERIVDLDRRDRMKSVLQLGEDSSYVYRGTVAYEKIFQKIDKVLSDGREWLSGDRFTLAEINLAPYLARLEYLDLIDVWTFSRPRVTAWFERLKARPSFQTEVVSWIRDDELQAMKQGGLRIKSKITDHRSTYLETDFGANIF